MTEYLIGLLWGIFIGFAVAVPIGPVGLICIQRTLAKNKMSGLISGFGAACADALLASVGAFSITVIFSFIADHQSVLQTIGGFLLFCIGIATLFSKTKDVTQTNVRPHKTFNHIEEFLSAFILTITNPLSIFSFFIAFAVISHKVGGNFHVALSFVIGIFIGSCLWWLFITSITDRIAHRINNDHIKSINKWFSIIITILGAIIVCGALS